MQDTVSLCPHLNINVSLMLFEQPEGTTSLCQHLSGIDHYLQVEKPQIERLFELADKDQSGSVDYEEASYRLKPRSAACCHGIEGVALPSDSPAFLAEPASLGPDVAARHGLFCGVLLSEYI